MTYSIDWQGELTLGAQWRLLKCCEGFAPCSEFFTTESQAPLFPPSGCETTYTVTVEQVSARGQHGPPSEIAGPFMAHPTIALPEPGSLLMLLVALPLLRWMGRGRV